MKKVQEHNEEWCIYLHAVGSMCLTPEPTLRERQASFKQFHEQPTRVLRAVDRQLYYASGR